MNDDTKMMDQLWSMEREEKFIMAIQDKFLKYVSFDTQSDASSPTAPSTAKQLELAKELVKELNTLGLEDVSLSKEGVVMAFLPATDPSLTTTIGFISHMDTASELSGKDVKPRIIEQYDGGTIHLNEEYSMNPQDFPELASVVGDSIIVTDGTTLLGNDDKAGIAIIMEMLEQLVNEKPKHGPIRIAFTPDEEVGRGVENFDLQAFPCDFAYTVDGGLVNEICYETFNAASARVKFHGKSIHPGSAKNRMINAADVAMHFASLLPQEQRPQHTEGREGFFHLSSMEGRVGYAVLDYIVRDHDLNRFEWRKQFIQQCADLINSQYGPVCEVELQDQYFNMAQFMHGDDRAIQRAKQAIAKAGLVPETNPVRGGTDGAALSQKGLFTPNLGTGGGNGHGRYEFASIDKMNKMVEIVRNIVEE